MDLMVADNGSNTRRSLLLNLVPMTQQRGRRAIEAGDTGKAVAANITRLRKRRELTTRQLSALLEANGRPIPASGITRMEKAERQVTVDELVALAAALRVNPSALLLPLDDDPAHMVAITGVGEVPADRAWDWVDGEAPIETVRPGDPTGALLLFQVDARPPQRRLQLGAE
ncbi:helix-turn-helix transcriptional regulator [Streptomyces sp. C1-2]|uniref:helix-turn-helix domain-containing protein n=1 Tax=Streptomyces sp. C1-2 TaxID=2720022 RepID=UPI0014327034|nr:helix-turn-helix transcriptional regulator [Streptomyces sp. C1-2]NJP72511.1 helix-turn-helix transcriptional regulator [Streptomyces sp. C1-2]